MAILIRTALIVLAVLSTTTTLYAQPIPGKKKPAKWGDVSPELLAMDHYAADTNAAAIILTDFGHVYFDRDNTLVFERHTRIKILKEAGYEHGTVAIPYFAKRQYGQRVNGVKAQTFTLDSNGKAIRHKMDKKAVFHENIDGDWKNIRFTLPALEPGAVIEYTYTITSENPLFLPDWQFQTSEPTLWSEYRADLPNRYQYVQATIGVLSFAVEEQEPLRAQDVVRHRWAMQDIPALRDEPFMTTPDDYRAALEFQLTKYYDSSAGMMVDYLNTWEDVADLLMDDSDFGMQLRPSRQLKNRVTALTTNIDTPLDKMITIYDFVRTTITWNGKRGVGADQDMDDVLKTLTASQPEMALLLATMLQAAGLEANPVLISTRSHGHIIEVYPLLTQFDAMLVQVKIDGKSYLLDPKDPLRPYDLIPFEALGGRGWVVAKDSSPTWISIAASERYQHQSTLEATLNVDGLLTATLKTSDSGYSALDKRYALQDAKTPEAFVADTMLGGLEEALVTSATVSQADKVSEMLRTTATFSVPAYAQTAGDFIYANVAPLGRVSENPLRSGERTFPIDLAYTRQVTYTFKLTLPEGFAVQDFPEDIRVRLPGDGGHFRRAIAVQGNVLTVQTQIKIKQGVFKPEYYHYLRAFYDRIVAAEAEQVVLKRVEDTDALADTKGEQ